MALKVKIRKWGHSLGLRIPKPLAESVGLREGTEAELRVVNGTLVLRPVRRYRLAELLEGLEETNRHPEVDWGEPKGREAF